MKFTSIKQKVSNGVDAKILFVLALAAGVSSILAMPYSLRIMGQSISASPELLKTALTGLIINCLVYVVFVYLGLRISKIIGIEPSPVLSGKVKLTSSLKLSVLLGIDVGLAMLLLDLLSNAVFIYPLKAGASLNTVVPGPVAGFLASFTGGITEEAQLRLFFIPLLSLLLIGILKLFRFAKTWKYTDTIVWISILLASILFGLGHLPAVAAVMYLTPLVIIRTILLNGIGGIVFGWLFFRKGIEFAMAAHFSADIVLHVIYPLLMNIS